MAARSRQKSEDAREIGPLPDVVNPRRKARCAKSLKLFCQTYFPRRFYLGWASFHLTAIDVMQECTDDGGLFAVAQPRGSGKTTIADCAVIRAVLYGLRRFVVFVGATDPLAVRAIKRITREFETNDLLLEDFPEVCHPIRCLERIHSRANGQTLNGWPTRIGWTADGVTLPTVAGSRASGSIIRVAGITGAVRGLNELAPDGQPLRPDLVILDDPQTRGSAGSLPETRSRVDVINDDVLGLSGPDVTIAAVMLCTPIYKGDLADQFLDREKNPEWKGQRTKMLEAFPSRMDLWDEYWTLRQTERREGGDGSAASGFYRRNRKEMDDGAVASWADRKKKGELSALQSAMNLFYRNPRGFRAEYQCEPEEEQAVADARSIDADRLVKRLTRVPRWEVPRETTRLTAFVDCGKSVLWYAVAAWDERFGGGVVDYGTWPRQPRKLFEAREVSPSLADLYPRLSEEQRLYAALRDLTNEILGRRYPRHGTDEMVTVGRCFVDEGWQDKVVYQFCRESAFANVLTPSQGWAAKTSSTRPMSQWATRPGERCSPPTQPGWRLGPVGTGKGRHCVFDADAWKSFLAERLAAEPGGPGCLQLFGTDPTAHQLLADHCFAETAAPVTIGGRTFDKWAVKPGRDNHLFDCLVGATVAAAVDGVQWSSNGSTPEAKPTGPRKEKWSDIQARKLAAAGVR